MPKLVGEKKSRGDDIQSMSAGVFLVLYPTLADYIVSVLKAAALSLYSCRSRHCVSEQLLLISMGDTPPDDTLLVTSPLLFPVLSLLCRLSPGLVLTDEGTK